MKRNEMKCNEMNGKQINPFGCCTRPIEPCRPILGAAKALGVAKKRGTTGNDAITPSNFKKRKAVEPFRTLCFILML